jgi:acyl dehydratase
MKVLAERTFTPDHQSRFAALSGDFNPMHMDAVAARRTLFGVPVVHGVHLLCWALDCWMRSRSPVATALERLTVKFTGGVLVGETVRVAVESDEGEFALRVQCDQSDRASIRCMLGPTLDYPEALPPMTPQACREMDYAALSEAQGSLPLAYGADAASQLFPHLGVSVPPFQFAALLAATRLVGMECPGLHSLFMAMDLSFAKEAIGPPELRFHVAQTDRFGGMRLAVEGPGFQGELRALLRPRPCKQAAAAVLARLVKEGEFSEQRAVVIGGSRGLGEVTAKLLALGGADVLITYHRGKEDADAVAADIIAAGGTCGVAPFDCQHPAPLALPEPPTHLYYFATPHITADKAVPFSPERFAEYCRYYVTSFAQTLLEVGRGLPMLEVFYPSTIFLDQAPANMTEYCAAKAAGEELCKQLANRFPAWRFYAPRLPRLFTDQNNGLLRPEMEASEIVILGHLRGMKRGLPT